jgi:putative peptidoglycan lipid II flippase
VLLRRALNARIGATGIPAITSARLWGAAGAAAASGWAVKRAAPPLPGLALAALVGAAFGATYLGLTAALGEGEGAAFVARLRRRLGRT